LRGVVANESILRDALGAARIRDATFKRQISLAGAEVVAPLHFANVIFESPFDFNGAIFTATFEFRGCRFKKELYGAFAFFNAGPPSWRECAFDRQVTLSYAHAARVSIGLEQCVFDEGLMADGIGGPLLMRGSAFKGAVSLVNASASAVVMDEATLEGHLDLEGASLQGLHAENARFHRVFQIGPAVVKHCYLSRAVFRARVRMEIQSEDLTLRGAVFEGGGTVFLKEGEVSLEQVSVGRHLLVAGPAERGSLPLVRSIRDADAGSMTFSQVSMKECIFYGAHNLAALTLESTVELPATPKFFSTRRRCIADEILWRISRGGVLAVPWRSLTRDMWKGGGSARPDPEPPAPDQIETVYRELRRGRESRSDQPGGADFYYGEMEMRRLNSSGPLADRFAVGLYWLLSGYGLRAARPLGMLFALLLASTVLLRRFGFPSGAVDWATAALFSLRYVLPGMRRSPVALTPLGEGIEIAIGFFGPALLALFVLALRGRVKR
jgi:uncharacterized protein YjbI with pentapeptide repeats